MTSSGKTITMKDYNGEGAIYPIRSHRRSRARQREQSFQPQHSREGLPARTGIIAIIFNVRLPAHPLRIPSLDRSMETLRLSLLDTQRTPLEITVIRLKSQVAVTPRPDLKTFQRSRVSLQIHGNLNARSSLHSLPYRGHEL